MLLAKLHQLECFSLDYIQKEKEFSTRSKLQFAVAVHIGTPQQQLTSTAAQEVRLLTRNAGN